MTIVRSISAAALAAGTMAFTAAPAARVTTKYRIDHTVAQEADATALGGGKQSASFTMSTFVTITLADSTGGRAMHIVIDSMRADSASPIPQAVLDSARGSTFHAFVSPTGQISNLGPVKAHPVTSQLQGVLASFYPHTKPAMKPGEVWNDTTDVANSGAGGSMKVRTVTAYKALASETRDATKALKIGSTFDQGISGSQQTPGGGTADISGTGKGSGTYYVAADGRYLGGSIEQQASLTVNGLGPAPLPVQVRQTTTVATLK